jgi:hypothetical protein
VKNKGRHYQKVVENPKFSLKTQKFPSKKRENLSTFFQLKLGHGYFKSYLSRLPDFPNANCDCNRGIQTPNHLIFNCRNYKNERRKLKEKIQGFPFRENFLFNSKIGISALLEFLEKTGIATRTWLNNLT